MKKLIVRKKQGVYVFPVENILYMEKELRKIRLHTLEYGDIEFYGKFNELLPFLDNRFLHCHRSYIINMDHIIVMACSSIFVADNQRIFLGRDTYNRARKIFDNYLSEKRTKTS